MIIKTKKYTLTPQLYLKVAMRHRLRADWFVFPIAAAIMSFTFFVHTIWFIVGAVIALSLYFLFWFIQYYGVRYLEQAQMLFLPATYEISGKEILMKITPNKGMPVEWRSVKKVVCSKISFLLVISKAQFVYLPFKIFMNEHEVEFFKFLLKKKGYMR